MERSRRGMPSCCGKRWRRRYYCLRREKALVSIGIILHRDRQDTFSDWREKMCVLRGENKRIWDTFSSLNYQWAQKKTRKSWHVECLSLSPTLFWHMHVEYKEYPVTPSSPSSQTLKACLWHRFPPSLPTARQSPRSSDSDAWLSSGPLACPCAESPFHSSDIRGRDSRSDCRCCGAFRGVLGHRGGWMFWRSENRGGEVEK